MEKYQSIAIMKFLENFRWLWGIRRSWNNVSVTAVRASRVTHELVADLLPGDEYYVYLEGAHGPELYKSPLEHNTLKSTLHYAAVNAAYVKALAIVKGDSIKILKPPTGGWHDLLRRVHDSM